VDKIDFPYSQHTAIIAEVKTLASKKVKCQLLYNNIFGRQ